MSLFAISTSLVISSVDYRLSTRLGVSNPNDQSLAQCPGSAGDRIQRNSNILRIEQTVKLGTTRIKFFCEGLFCFLLFPHGFCKLPRDHTLDRNRLDFLSDALFLQETVKSRTRMLNHTILFRRHISFTLNRTT